MACIISCSISAIFVIGMIYFYTMTNKSSIVNRYKSLLSSDLKKKYEKITEERTYIAFQGYILGIILSLGIIFYNLTIKKDKLNTLSLICIVVATSFITNYFYYILYPKTEWMLNHINNPEEVKAWLLMYKEMQYNYHMGLVLGIIAVGMFAFAFRC